MVGGGVKKFFSEVIFFLFGPHPRPFAPPISINVEGEETSAFSRCDKFGEGEETPASALERGKKRPPVRAYDKIFR